MYDLIKGAIIASPMVAAIIATVRKVFGRLKDPRDAFYLWLGTSGTIGLALFLLSNPQQPRPAFYIADLRVGYGEQVKTGPPGANVVLLAALTNRGAIQSVAGNFGLTAEVNGHTYVGLNEHIQGTIRMSAAANGTTITYFSDDALYERANSPVPVGGSVQGILHFNFPDLNQDAFTAGTTLTFALEDAFGQIYSRPITLTGKMSAVAGWIPGLHQEATPPS